MAERLSEIETAFAWAAVAPNCGRPQIEPSVVRARAAEVRKHIGGIFRRSDEPSPWGWRRAYSRGWRVVRVQISPAFAERLKEGYRP